MKESSHISDKTKLILTIIGIVFGTAMVFLISFILSFSLIVNPINFMTVSDDETLKENEDLKAQIQTLEDENELLNTTVEKYKNSAASKPQTPLVTTPSSSESNKSQSANPKPQTETKPKSDSSTAPSANTEQNNVTESGSENTSDAGGETQNFSPETVTSTAETTPEDTEAPITVIDISE